MNAPIYRLENVVHDKRTEEHDFVGPLDLILHLLSKNKLEIGDISVAQIVDQYLEWVAERQELDLEVASEFIAMAAHLLYIKSRMLLSAQDEEAATEMELLLASLEERQRNEIYQRIKLGAPTLRKRYETGSGYIARPPQTPPEKRWTYVHESAELQEAMLRIASRSRQKLPPSPKQFYNLVRPEPYPVEKKSVEILERLTQDGALRLTELWRSSGSRTEVVAVFLSVLELCRMGKLELFWAEEGDASLRLSRTEAEHTA